MTDPTYTDLADAMLVFVFCLLTLLLHSVTTGFILCMFLSLAVSFASELPRKAYGKSLVQMTWPILCLLVPEGWYFLPLLGFATARASLWALYIPDALILLYRGKQAPAVAAFLMTGMVLAFALARKNALLDERTRKMHESRDDITARSKALAERNRELQRQQDAEIYAATLKERNRIAWQIHDNVGHILSRTILMVGALKTVNEDPKLTEPLDQIEHSLQTAMNSIRDSVRELHDDSIDLKAASTALLRGFTFCQAEFRYDMNVHAEPAVKYAFLAVLKEALDQIDLTRSKSTQMPALSWSGCRSILACTRSSCRAMVTLTVPRETSFKEGTNRSLRSGSGSSAAQSLFLMKMGSASLRWSLEHRKK